MNNLKIGQEIVVSWNNQIIDANATVAWTDGNASRVLGQFIVAKLDTPVDQGRGYMQVTVSVWYNTTLSTRGIQNTARLRGEG